MENCGCIYISNLEYPTFYREIIRKAKKPHKCIECRKTISPGETYYYTTGKWDGNIEVYKTCFDCQSVKNAFFCESYFFGTIWDDVQEHIDEMEGNISSDCLLKLTKGARDKVCDLIEEVWQDMDDRLEG